MSDVKIYYFHEDDNYSKDAADTLNFDSGYGKEKCKCREFVGHYAYQAIQAENAELKAKLESIEKICRAERDQLIACGQLTKHGDGQLAAWNAALRNIDRVNGVKVES